MELKSSFGTNMGDSVFVCAFPTTNSFILRDYCLASIENLDVMNIQDDDDENIKKNGFQCQWMMTNTVVVWGCRRRRRRRRRRANILVFLFLFFLMFNDDDDVVDDENSRGWQTKYLLENATKYKKEDETQLKSRVYPNVLVLWT